MDSGLPNSQSFASVLRRHSAFKPSDGPKQRPTDGTRDSEQWPVGSNFIPADAINQLEMWQADTFDPQEIDKELGWAQAIGMNTMRVFLHDLLWQQDAARFRQRIDTFLTIADKHHIRPIFVLFDSCWDPDPKLGPQHPPIPGVHNSGWVQSPGEKALRDTSQYPRLKTYVQGVIGAFANDRRILAWDLWNEPSNGNDSSYLKVEPKNKNHLILALLPQVFGWAREAHPSQPLTSGVWTGDWSSLDKMDAMSRLQIEESDIISFHNYGWPEEFEQHVQWLMELHRPIICTEYMARGVGSTFDTILADRKAIPRSSDQLGDSLPAKHKLKFTVGFLAASLRSATTPSVVS